MRYRGTLYQMLSTVMVASCSGAVFAASGTDALDGLMKDLRIPSAIHDTTGCFDKTLSPNTLQNWLWNG